MRLVLPPSLGHVKAGARAELVAAELSRFAGVTAVDVALDYGALREMVLGKQTDLAWAPPALCAHAFPVAHAVLKAVRRGRASYSAALVCRAAEPLDLRSLSGKRAAWVDPLSTGGHLLPKAYLARSGVELGTERFEGSYRDAVLAVVSGTADVAAVYTTGATATAVQRVLEALVGGIAARLGVVAFTAEGPSDGLVLGHRLSATVAADLAARFQDDPPPMLLEAFDADALVPAGPSDYEALAF